MPRTRLRHVVASGWFVSFGLFYEPMRPRIRRRFEHIENIIHGFNDQVRADGRKLTVLIFPTRIQVDEDHWRATVRAYGLDESKFDLLAPNRELHDFFSRHDIDYVDLTTALRADQKEFEEPLFLPLGDMHFSAHAQGAVARAIAERQLSDRRALGARASQPSGTRSFPASPEAGGPEIRRIGTEIPIDESSPHLASRRETQRFVAQFHLNYIPRRVSRWFTGAMGSRDPGR
jgi:hypothetical protein